MTIGTSNVTRPGLSPDRNRIGVTAGRVLLAAALAAAVTACGFLDSAETDNPPLSTPTNVVSTTIIGVAPAMESEGENSDEPVTIGDIACAGECGDGYAVDGREYTLTCGLLDLESYVVTEPPLVIVDLRWSDDPVTISTIESVDASQFMAIKIDPDICQGGASDDSDGRWYVASTDREFPDWPRFCELIGTTDDGAGGCI